MTNKLDSVSYLVTIEIQAMLCYLLDIHLPGAAGERGPTAIPAKSKVKVRNKFQVK